MASSLAAKNSNYSFALLKRLIRKLSLSSELYAKNELTNHAAAGAYGFLLSAAPIFIFVALFITRAFSAWPDWVKSLLKEVEILAANFNIKLSLSTILEKRNIGLPALIIGINLIWTSRVFALSLQRGSRVIFLINEREHFLRKYILTIFIELAVIIFILGYAISSQLTIDLFRQTRFFISIPYIDILFILLPLILPFFGLACLCFLAYRFIPYRKPSLKSSIRATLICISVYSMLSFSLKKIINFSKYNLFYGTLGGMLVFLVNVYFFFILFYWGAQFAFVEDNFDELCLRHFFRLSKNKADGNYLQRHLFSFPEKLIQSYSLYLGNNDILFNYGDAIEHVYFVLNGNLEIYSQGDLGNNLLDITISQGEFLGDSDFLVKKYRTRQARSHGPSLVLALPKDLFLRILNIDPTSSIHVIEGLSRRLENNTDNGDNSTSAQENDREDG